MFDEDERHQQPKHQKNGRDDHLIADDGMDEPGKTTRHTAACKLPDGTLIENILQKMNTDLENNLEKINALETRLRKLREVQQSCCANKPIPPKPTLKPTLPVKPPAGARDCKDVMDYGGAEGVHTIMVRGHAVKVMCRPGGYTVCTQAIIASVTVNKAVNKQVSVQLK